MPVFPRYSRVISFRVSKEEYDVLSRVSEQQGAHSVSDYARWIVRHGIEDTAMVKASLPDQVRSLTVRVEELSKELARLKAVLSVA